MSLSEPFIRRPIMTALVMATVLLFGCLAYHFLPVSDLPNVDLPTIKVSVSYPGASPETMANSVATPLEQQFMTIQGIRTIFSTSNTGSTSIVIQFELERDIDSASTDVQAAISRAEPNLPSDLPNNPTYQKVNPAATPILYFAIFSPAMSEGALYDYANTFIGQRFSMVDGVSQVITYGSPFAVRVQVDPGKLAAKNIGIDQVTNTLRQGNVDLPLGSLWGPRENYTVAADGQLFSADPYAELVIKNEDGSLVKVRDIGRSLNSVQNDKFFHTYVTKEKSHPCIVLAVQRAVGSNTVKVVQAVSQMLAKMQPQLPKTLQIATIYDQSEAILAQVFDVKVTLLIALGLVVLIIYLFLGKGLNTLIPTLTLPIAIFGTFALMALYGFSIDLLSLLAITLSIGFLVDDAIVVLENNVRYVQMGASSLEAATRSANQISTTVLSMTLCLIAAFIPLLFMQGVVGRLFREFAVSIVTVVSISGFVALSLTPLLCSRFIRPYDGKLKKMEAFSERITVRLKQIYKPCLLFALDHGKTMLCIGTACVLGSIFFFFHLPTDFIPNSDIGFVQGFTLSADGTSPFLMRDYHKNACDEIIQDPNVESILSISSYTNPNEGVLFLRMPSYEKRKPMTEVISELSQKMRSMPGINFFFSPIPIINLQVGTTAQANYQYSLTSIDQKELYTYAPKLLDKIKRDPHFSQVSSDLRNHQPQWALHILREKAANFNIQAFDVERFLTYAYSDNKISQINGDINQYDVLIETLPQFYRDPTVISQLFIRSNQGNLVPLSEIVTVNETIGPLTVNHVNGLPAVSISFNPAPDVSLGTALQKLEQIAKIERPTQIYGQTIGTAEVFSDSFHTLPLLLILSLFVIYVVLGILYESLIHPLTVMSALPPAVFGGLLTLFAFQESISLYSFVGLILLMGMVLKNGIMMVDFAIDAVEKEKKAPFDAIVEASLIRFRPILMTTLAAMMGAVPVALGIGGAFASSIRPLGLCIIGGLCFSQLLTLLLTPVLFLYFARLKERLENR